MAQARFHLPNLDTVDRVADVHTFVESQGSGDRGYRFVVRIESDRAKSSSV